MTIFSLLLILAGSPVLAGDEPVTEPTEQALPWVMDISVAREMASKEGKDILINFTGSDWCGWCKRLDAEVFVHPVFHETAGKQYIYLYLDFPRGEEAMAKVIDEALNNENRDQMSVNGFPTIILADSQMRPYGRTGYQPGGPEKYLEHLAELRTKGEKVQGTGLRGKRRTDSKATRRCFLGDAGARFAGSSSIQQVSRAGREIG